MKTQIISVRMIVLFMISTIIVACNSQEAYPVTNELNNKSIQVGNNILDIFEDRNGILWFGTSELGVLKYEPNNEGGKNKAVYLNDTDGLCGKTVANIAEDKNGQLWFGTLSDMCIYQPNLKDENNTLFSTFPKEGEIPLLGYGWKSVQTDPYGDIWVNTHHGVFKREGNGFTEMEVPIYEKDAPGFCSTPGKISLALIDSKGNKWFRTDGDGVYLYEASEAKLGTKLYRHFTMNEGLRSNNVSNIVEDKNGTIWFACFKFNNDGIKTGGLCKYTPLDNLNIDRQIQTFQNKKGLYNNSITTIYSDDLGDVWVGATGVGVYKIEPSSQINGNEKFTLFAEPSDIDSSDGFSVDGLQSVLKDSRGKVWFGFSGGLYALDGETIVNVTLDDLRS